MELRALPSKMRAAATRNGWNFYSTTRTGPVSSSRTRPERVKVAKRIKLKFVSSPSMSYGWAGGRIPRGADSNGRNAKLAYRESSTKLRNGMKWYNDGSKGIEGMLAHCGRSLWSRIEGTEGTPAVFGSGDVLKAGPDNLFGRKPNRRT